jgi:hypothetical protein
MAVTVVIAWDSDLNTVLEARPATNKRHAKVVAEELAQDYPWSPRISFYVEVDFIATEAGMSEDEVRKAQARLERRP